MATKPIKLFVDAHSFDAGYQGTQTFIRELYVGLMNIHPDLDIYWGVHDPEKILSIFPWVKPENILPYKKRITNMLRFVFDIPAYIKQYRFDYAHFQYITPLQKAGCQYIVTTHDVLFNDFPASFSYAYRISRNLLFGMSIRNAAIKTTVSNYSKQRIAHHYNIPSQQITVIANGVNKPTVAKYAARELIRSKYGIQNFILYVSRIEPRKNHLLLFDKYLKLELYKQNIPLVFIGQLSIVVDALKTRVANLTAEQQAFFHWFPQVEQNDIQAFYSACRVFVYPSKAEGFGIPPLEASVCEVPVLCSSTTAMSDFSFFEPDTFDPDNEAELEHKLAAIIANPPSPKALKNIAETVLAKHQWQQSAQLFHNLLTIGLRHGSGKFSQPTAPIHTKHSPLFTI